MRIVNLSLVVPLLLAASAFAQQTDMPAAQTVPATNPTMNHGPATAPAVVPSDPATPRGALKTLMSAIQNGDDAQIHKLVFASNPSEQKAIDALARRAHSEKSFRDAAVKAFGAEAAKSIVGDVEQASVDSMSQIDASDEKVTGETATVSGPGGDEPVKLQRSNGIWQIPVTEFIHARTPAELDRSIEDVNFGADLISGYAADVAGGKYKAALDARAAIEKDMQDKIDQRRAETAGRNLPPTTEPTSQPSGGGSVR